MPKVVSSLFQKEPMYNFEQIVEQQNGKFEVCSSQLHDPSFEYGKFRTSKKYLKKKKNPDQEQHAENACPARVVVGGLCFFVTPSLVPKCFASARHHSSLSFHTYTHSLQFIPSSALIDGYNETTTGPQWLQHPPRRRWPVLCWKLRAPRLEGSTDMLV